LEGMDFVLFTQHIFLQWPIRSCSLFMQLDMTKRIVRVITYGTFDVLHKGHIRLLKRARALGDHLVVGLSTDAFNRIKGKHSVFNFEDRKLILRSLRFVDRVIPERKWEQKVDDIKRNRIDIFVIGDDWKGKFDHLKSICTVYYLSRTSGISTSRIKRRVARMNKL
jgi:glycerol-3-phosphate cytidylyltransferase